MKVDISKIQWKSHILIIDYNTFHYTSFDIFRMMLLNKDHWKALLPEYKPFFRLTYQKQMKFFFERQLDRDLYHLFSIDSEKSFPMNMYDLIDSFYAFDGRVMVDTDLNIYLRTALQSNTIGTISILRHPDDSSPLNVPDTCKMFRSKGLFDGKLIADFIDHNRIDAVILDSVDLALEIGEHTEQTTFIFGSYRYNYEINHKRGLRYLKRMDEMNRLELQKHHQYGRFVPIRELNNISLEGIINDKKSGDSGTE